MRVSHFINSIVIMNAILFPFDLNFYFELWNILLQRGVHYYEVEMSHEDAMGMGCPVVRFRIQSMWAGGKSSSNQTRAHKDSAMAAMIEL